MAQTDFKSLVLELNDFINNVKEYKQLLDIGIEQLSPDSPETITRFMFLVNVFSDYFDCQIEDIDFILMQLRGVSPIAIAS